MSGNPVIVDALMIAFSAALLLAAAVAVLKFRTVAPVRMQARLDREVAERLAAMAMLARNYPEATPDVRERLLLNYRYHRVSVLALAPASDIRSLDAAFAETGPALRVAA